MWYVYIIESSESKKTYVGHTDNLERRVNEHNNGLCKYTSKFNNWKIRAYIAIENESIAIKLEKYLKSGSGRATLKKRLLGG